MKNIPYKAARTI